MVTIVNMAKSEPEAVLTNSAAASDDQSCLHDHWSPFYFNID